MTDSHQRCSSGTNTPHPVETLWREIGLPEYFLGNGGTNAKLYELYDRILGNAQDIPAVAAKAREPVAWRVDGRRRGHDHVWFYWKPEWPTMHEEHGDKVTPLYDAPGVAQQAGWPKEPPLLGPNYRAGLWSRENYEAMIEDFQKEPAVKTEDIDDYTPSKWVPMTDPQSLAALGKLSEECGELTSIIARVIIQGIDECDPETGELNREALAKELADVLALSNLVVKLFNFDKHALNERAAKKLAMKEKWLEMLR